MAVDMLVDSGKLDACCAAEAAAIIAKGGGTAPLAYDFANNKGFADAIEAIPSGGAGGNYNIESVDDSNGGQILYITDAAGSKAAQASDSMERVSATSYTSTNVSLTVAKTGTYTVRWYGYRTSTSGTNGSQLYIGNTAYGSEQTTFGVNSNGQTVKLTGVQLTEGQTITVRARSRGSMYYMFVMGLSIIEE